MLRARSLEGELERTTVCISEEFIFEVCAGPCFGPALQRGERVPDTAAWASSPTARHPASPAAMALVGERVVVSGLLRRPELNSRVGEATSFDEANGCVSSQAHAHPPAASLLSL